MTRDNYDGHAGNEKRRPKNTQSAYLHLSRLSTLLKKFVEKYVPEESGVVLDLGCGEKPYQPFFLGKSTVYLDIDVSRSKFVDILCKGEKLPFKNDVFSACLCTQALEHTDNPVAVINEIFRILRPNALVFPSTHSSYPTHMAPFDYWRWTEYGLGKIFSKFHVHRIYECRGPAASIIQLMELFIAEVRTIGVVLVFFLNKLGDFLDKISWISRKVPQLITAYLVIAEKRATKSRQRARIYIGGKYPGKHHVTEHI